MILKVNGDLGASIWNKKMVYSKYLPSLIFMDVVIYLVGFCITNLRIDVQKKYILGTHTDKILALQ